MVAKARPLVKSIYLTLGFRTASPTLMVVVAFTLKAVSQLTLALDVVRHATGTLDQFIKSVDLAQA